MLEQPKQQPIITEVPRFEASQTDTEAQGTEPTPAEMLGLTDGEFQVVRGDPRTSTTVERGWTVSGFARDQYDRMGNRVSMVQLTKEEVSEEGGRQILDKVVPEPTLKSWQEQVAEQTQEQDEERDIGFDHLFEPDYDASKVSVEDAAVRGPEGRQAVTDESVRSAVQSLNLAKLADDHISRIIAEHNPTQVSGVELVEKLRTDPELRTHLGKYLMSKFDEYRVAMGDRVQRDVQKRPNYKGYEHLGALRSSEYVPLLAMSMIDGTFIDAREDHEQVKDNGAVTNGEHRQAARLVLTGRPVR
jgi:hypothetical protein